MNIHDFKATWSGASLNERAASQEHFIDLCRALGMQTPAEADSEVAFYTLDRAVWAAYGWDEDPAKTDDETILRRRLALNLERAG